MSRKWTKVMDKTFKFAMTTGALLCVLYMCVKYYDFWLFMIVMLAYYAHNIERHWIPWAQQRENKRLTESLVKEEKACSDLLEEIVSKEEK